MICDFGFGEEWLPVWYDRGLPRGVDGSASGRRFGMGDVRGRLRGMLPRLGKGVFEGAEFEAGAFGEGMRCSGGPLPSPRHPREFLVRRYRRVDRAGRESGCEVLWGDGDGRIDRLLPLWLAAGVHTMFPMEVGAWGPTRSRSDASLGASCC